MKNKKNGGFTLIELLAVIVILGILIVVTVPSLSRLIKKTKDENRESSRNTLEMAAKSYAENNKKVLPKSIGEIKTIKIADLKNANFLKEDIKSADKESCMKNSYVKIFKYDKDKYNFVTYLYCGDEVPDEDDEKYNSKIAISFTDGNDQELDIAKNKVTSAKVKIKFESGLDQAKEKVGLHGYNYIIRVKYTDDKDYLEIYNSGSINAYGKEVIEVNKNISKYIDIKGATDIEVIAEVYDRAGNYKKLQKRAKYKDKEAPKCGEVIGEAIDENDWDGSIKRRTISVKCFDEGGSGCIKDTFTKTFTKETEWDYITIKDNAGNSAKCKVRVNLDWTPPSLIIKAFKKGTNEEVGEAHADADKKNEELKKYKNGYGNDNWLNKANYPNGIYYKVIVDEDNTIGKLTTNKTGLLKSSTDVKVLDFNNYPNNFDNIREFTFTEDGYRNAKYSLMDKAKNEVTISITAAIDRVAPTTPIVRFWKKKSIVNITSSAGLTESYSPGTLNNESWSNKFLFVEATGSTDAISQLNGYRYKIGSNPEGNGSFYNFNSNVKNQSIQFKACDNAGNCSGFVPGNGNNLISIDTTPPKCTINTTPDGYISGKWTNQDVKVTATCKDTVSGCTTTSTSKYYDKGTNTFAVTFSDIAGNTVNCPSVNVKIDKEAPECGSQSPKATTWTKSNRKITLKCKDKGSGCKKNTYTKTFDSGCSEESEIEIEDKAGNKQPCDINVYVDKVAPIVVCKYEGSSYEKNMRTCLDAYPNPIPFYYTCTYTDVCSGLASRSVTWGKGVNTRYAKGPISGKGPVTDYLCTVDSKNAGAKIQKYSVKDKAGNETKSS